MVFSGFSVLPVFLLTLVGLWPRASWGFDKQGSAHGGAVGEGPRGFGVSGSVTLGSSVLNSSYAARPDNTGLAGMRYAAHLDVDLMGPLLSLPVDLNVFSDKTRAGLKALAPSELDVILGVTSTHALSRALSTEFGARVERDSPVDQGSYTQTYADARAKLLYSLRGVSPKLASSLNGGNLSGSVTLGWFAFNPTYAARPDNTGLALLRYGTHHELAVWRNHLALGADATLFTDKQGSNVLAPTELDFTYEIIARYQTWSAHLAYERDMPLDRGGLVQSFVYTSLAYDFDLRRSASH